ncbi:MAG: S-layer homology domain-containing protein [Pseudoflavonifractor sp.]|nr:S-layer homology domain-containing protein [Pseudoflavonifractor sp.]
MRRRVLSFILALAVILGLFPTMQPYAAAAGGITARVTMSFGGAVIENKNAGDTGYGRRMYAVEVPLSGSTHVEDAVTAALEYVGIRDDFVISNGYFSSYAGNTSGNYLCSEVYVDGVPTGGALSGELTERVYIDAVLYSYGDPPDSVLFFTNDSAWACSDAVTVGDSPSLLVGRYDWDQTLFYGYGGYGSTAYDESCAAVTYYTCSDGYFTATDNPFSHSGTVYAVAQKSGCAPAVLVVTVKPMTVYVTADFCGEALTARSDGSLVSSGAVPSGYQTICAPVELTSFPAKVDDVLKQLSRCYYSAGGETDDYLSYSYGDSIYLSSFWDHSSGSTYDLGSIVFLNGTDTGAGNIGTDVSDGDCITLHSFSYSSGNYVVPAYIADAQGACLGAKSITTGTTLSFKASQYGYSDVSYAYSETGSAALASSAYGIYVVCADDAAKTGALTASYNNDDCDYTDYSYTFIAPGTYYILGVDTGSDSTCSGVAAERIVVADSVTNSAPVRKSGVPAAAVASTYVGKPYTLNLSSIFRDENGDELSYYVSLDGGEYTAVGGGIYRYLSAAAGTTTHVFKAFDGADFSAGTYTVTLTSAAAALPSDALCTLSDYFTDSANVTPYGTDNYTQWALADIAAYRSSLIPPAIKQEFADYVVYNISANSSAADLARFVIVLKALGYDAAKIDQDGTGNYFDAARCLAGIVNDTSKLTKLDIYTLPYVLIAFQQYGDLYAAEVSLLKTAIMGKALSSGGWGYSAVDADTCGSVLLAMSPYYPETTEYNDSSGTSRTIGYEIDACLGAVRSLQNPSTGAIGSGNYVACSTGVLMAGLAACGESPAESQYLSKSLTDGLMFYYSPSSRFQVYSGDMLSDEEALRGLAAADQYVSNGRPIYDFSTVASTAPVLASAYYDNCLVSFSVVPANAAVTVKSSDGTLQTALTGNSYDLEAGDYSYTVSCSGYTGKAGGFTVSAAEVSEHAKKALSVSLACLPSAGSTISVKFSIKWHGLSNDTCSNSYTYIKNSSAYSDIISTTVTLSSGSSVFDALDAACSAAGIAYTEGSPGYITAINGLSEFEHGESSGWLYRVGSTVPTADCRSYPLTSNCTVIWFYTDNFSSEYGSESWSETTPSTITPVGVIAGGTGRVSFSAEITDTSAEIAISDDDLQTILNNAISGGNGNITVDLSSLDGVDTVIMSVGTLAAFNGNSSVSELKIQGSGFGVTLDAAALSAVVKEAGSEDDKLMLRVAGAAPPSLTQAQGAALESSPEPLLHLRAFLEQYDSKGMSTGEKELYKLSGQMTVSFAFKLEEGQSSDNLAVSYLDDEGNSAYQNSWYSGGTIYFITSHFSTYFIETCAIAAFKDCDLNAWYHASVEYVLSKGLMQGTGEDSFEPTGIMTRSMLVIVLWRCSGASDTTLQNPFSDVPGEAWNTDAVAWAWSEGIVLGYDAARFGFSDALTREQMVTILYRFAQYRGTATSGPSSDLSAYSDTGDISDWARDAFSWAVSTDIVKGGGNKLLSPKSYATRSELASVLMRFMEK